MRRAHLLLLVVAIALALAFWLLRDRDAPTPPPAEASSPTATDGEPRPAESPAADEASSHGGGVIMGGLRRGETPVAGRVWLWRLRDDTCALPREFRRVSRHAEGIGAGTFAKVASSRPETGFHFAGLPPGRYRLVGLAEDGAAARASARIQSPATSCHVDVVFGDGPHDLRARVVHADARPFSGWAHTRGRWARTAKDGRFTIVGLPAGVVRVDFLLEGELCAEGPRIRLPSAREHLIVVDEGVRPLAGRVVSATDGRPIPGARVLARGLTPLRRQVLREARTGAEGRFRMDVPSVVELDVTADGHWSVHLWDLGARDRVEVRLEPSSRVEGRVVRAGDGRPLAGVAVFLDPLDGVSRLGPVKGARTVTDDEGRFAFSDVPAVEVMVFARGSGWTSRGLGDARHRGHNPLAVPLEPGGGARVTLVAEPAFRVEGRVVEAGGRAAAGARVVAAPRYDYRVLPFEPTETVTDAEGGFVLPTLVPAYTYGFRAEADNGLRVARGPAHTGRPGERLELTMELPEARRVEVRVTDARTGEPVSRAAVGVSGPSRQARPRFRSWVTDEEGRVVVKPLPEGHLQLWARHPEHLESRSAVLYQYKPLPETVDLRMERSHAVTGVILMPDGTPARSGLVRCRLESSGITDEGEFRVTGLPPGRSVLRAECRVGEARYAGRFEVSAGKEDLRLRLRREEPEDGPGVIEVLVLDVEGRPVPRAALGMRAVGEAGEELWSGNGHVLGGRGEVDLEGGEREVWVEVSRPASASGVPLPLGPARAGPLAPETGSIEVRLPPEKVVTGVVRGADGGPVESVLVHATPCDLMAHTDDEAGRTDTEGRFRIGRLAEGEYELSVRGPRTAGPRDEPRVRAGARGVVLTLGRRVETGVRVLDPEGGPVEGAWVHAYLLRSHGVRDWSNSEARTDGAGRAVLHRLTEGGRFRLEVAPPDSRPDLAEGWCEHSPPGDAEFRLEPGRSVTGRLLGDGPRDLEIWAKPSEGRWREVRREEDGTFEVASLPAGPVVLVVLGEEEGEEMLRKAALDRAVTVPAGTEGVELRRPR